MKYLLYYNVNSDFVSDQVEAGGDGSRVVSVVDGVAWTNDQENVYYRYTNNDSENLTSYTVTVHYVDLLNGTIAPDDILSVDAYVGKSASVVIIPKQFSGYVIDVETLSLTLSSNTEYTFTYEYSDLSRLPLCFNILTSGKIYWKKNVAGADGKKISYSTDYGNTWTEITSTQTNSSFINVSAGDKVFFIGYNNVYANANGHYSYFSSEDTSFEIEGNIMSLTCGLAFSGGTALYSRAFKSMFNGCTGLTSAKNLVFKKVVIDECYNGMFYGCTSLTQAPELPATTLASYCYYGMFYGCTNLNYIKCLATNISASNCTTNWVNGVASVGAFVKNPNMTGWTTGNNGIPTNWTIQNNS